MRLLGTQVDSAQSAATVTGTITYREKILVPHPDVMVSLIDLTVVPIGPALAMQTFRPKGGPPYPYELG